MSDFYQNSSVSTNFIRVLNRKFDGSPSGGSRGRTHDEQTISRLASEGAKFVVQQ